VLEHEHFGDEQVHERVAEEFQPLVVVCAGTAVTQRALAQGRAV
jgi:hypothetical protein